MTTATATATADPSAAIYESLNKTNTKTATSADATQDRFLKLLVTQLKNQDPLNPMDNAQMTSQMAQISTVNGIEKLNATLQALMDNSNASQSLQASSLVGHVVLVPGTGLKFKAADGAAYGGVDLAGAADQVTVTINDANGLTVRTMYLGEQKAGTVSFQWDGKADNGSVVADGNYSIGVAAKQAENKVEVTALQFGTVSSIMSGSQGTSVNVAGMGTFKMSDVKEIL